jgi:hypothetical protein
MSSTSVMRLMKKSLALIRPSTRVMSSSSMTSIDKTYHLMQYHEPERCQVRLISHIKYMCHVLIQFFRCSVSEPFSAVHYSVNESARIISVVWILRQVMVSCPFSSCDWIMWTNTVHELRKVGEAPKYSSWTVWGGGGWEVAVMMFQMYLPRDAAPLREEWALGAHSAACTPVHVTF